MRVVASEEARRYVAERGGRLYVWMSSSACCHSVPRLDSATEPKSGREYRRVANDDFEVWFPQKLERLPDELHVEVHRFLRRRVEAYWDGCVWIV